MGTIASKPVLTVGSMDSLMTAARIMSANRIGSVVVLEDESPVGIITERDMIDMMSRDVSPIHNHSREVMSRPLHTADVNQLPMDGLSKMGQKKIRRLPVVKDSRLVGIVTQRDLMRWLVRDQSALRDMLAAREKNILDDGISDLLAELYLTG